MNFSWIKLSSLMTLLFSIYLCCSSQSWFLIWVSFEVNLLSFIFFCFEPSNMSVNSLMKYFIIQSVPSMFMFIFFCISFYFLKENFLNFFISLSMMFKLGMAPFHFWLSDICEGFSWTNFFIFSSLQKFMPLFVINMTSLNIFFILLSVIFGCFLMFNQISLRKFLVYSSLIHMSWMIFPISMNSMFWVSYLGFYSFSLFSLILLTAKKNFSSIPQFFFSSPSEKWMIFMILLNLSGLPPFIMFFPKITIINMVLSLFCKSDVFVLSFLLISSIISCFMYIRFFSPSISLSTLKFKNSPLSISLNPYLMIFLVFLFLIFSFF